MGLESTLAALDKLAKVLLATKVPYTPKLVLVPKAPAPGDRYPNMWVANTMVQPGDLPPDFTGAIFYAANNVYDLYYHYVNGKLHRDLGPAIESFPKGVFWAQGGEWFLNGINFTAQEYWSQMLLIHKGTDTEALVLTMMLVDDK